jgi:hypothetical protein
MGAGRPAEAVGSSDARLKGRWLPHPFRSLIAERVGDHSLPSGLRPATALRAAGRSTAIRSLPLQSLPSHNAESSTIANQGVCGQSAFYRVAMHISQFLSSLSFAGDDKIVIATLPELGFARMFQFSGGLLLQHLHHCRKRAPTSLVDEQMNVLWHQDIPGDCEPVPNACSFEFSLEDTICTSARE